MSKKYTIYLIENDLNYKTYIGLTKYLNRRLDQHKWLANSENKEKYYLHQAISKYGWNNFSHYILLETNSKDFAIEQEKRYIKVFNTYDSNYGYNLDKGGSGCDQLGGENHHNVKVSDDKILKSMMKFIRSEKELKSIARELNMHPGSLRSIFSGNIRSYLQKEFKERYGIEFKSKYSQKDKNKVIKAIKLHYKENKSYKNISKILNVSDSTIMRWCKGQRRRDIYNFMKDKINSWQSERVLPE